MREHVKADEHFERERRDGRGGDRALPARGPGLQGRADRGPDRERGRRHRLALHERPLHRPLPRPARPEHQAHQGVQADVHRRRLLARRLRASRCSPASTAPRSSPRRTSSEHLERLEQARARDHRKLGRELDLFMLQRPLARARRSGSPHGTHIWNELTDLWRSENVARGYTRGAHADPLRRRAVEAVRATGTSTATTCTSPTSRAGRWA